MKQEKTTPISASQRKVKHVKVFDEQHNQIKETVGALTTLFCKKAKALGIPIIKRGKNRNVPGQADAVRCLLQPHYESGFDGLSIENIEHWYIEDLFKKMGVQ